MEINESKARHKRGRLISVKYKNPLKRKAQGKEISVLKQSDYSVVSDYK